MALFEQSGRVFKKADDLFGESSWIQVMIGQGLLPKQYHPIVDQMSDEELQHFLTKIKDTVSNKVKKWPDVNDFIQHYCPSKMM